MHARNALKFWIEPTNNNNKKNDKNKTWNAQSYEHAINFRISDARPHDSYTHTHTNVVTSLKVEMNEMKHKYSIL